MSPERTARGAGWTLAGVAAAVGAARLGLVQGWGSPVPFWDQWDAEAWSLYRPWLEGTLGWRDFFAAHNEHRIALTRAADLVLFWLAGGWNPWWQLILNSVLQALAAALLCRWLPPAANRAGRLAGVLGLVVLFAAPAGWQNALWGFQSQVLFGDVLVVIALTALSAGPATGWRWWRGPFAVLLALFSNAGGLLTAAVALAVVFLTAASEPPERRRWWQGGAVLALLLGFAWCLQVAVQAHAPLRASSPGAFFAVFTRSLGWPWVDSTWAWLVLQLPALWLVVNLFRQRRLPDRTERVLLGLVLWGALQAAAIAWSRGGGLPSGRPLSRYQDPLVLATAANLLLVLRLVGTGRPARYLAALWGTSAALGIVLLTAQVGRVNLPYKQQQDAIGLAQVRAYLRHPDPALLQPEPGTAPLHPNAESVRRVLDEPVLRDSLPREFRAADIAPPWPVRYASGFALLALILLIVANRPARSAA